MPILILGCAMVGMSRKNLLILFSLIFISGVFIRIFVSPTLWPNIPEVVDPRHIVLSSIAVLVVLSLVYLMNYSVGISHLKVYGTPKTIRLFYTLTIGLALGFAIFAVIATISKFFMEYTFKGSYFYLVFISSYVIAFIVVNYWSKRLHA